MCAMAQRTVLGSGWTFKNAQDSNDAWKPVGQVPTVVHLDLMANGLFVSLSIFENPHR